MSRRTPYVSPELTPAFWINLETLAPMGNVVVLMYLSLANWCPGGDFTQDNLNFKHGTTDTHLKRDEVP